MRDEAEPPRCPRPWIRLIILIPVILALSVRLIGIRHGEPDMVYHPDVPKQTRIFLGLYRDGTVDLHKLYRDNIHFIMYPYGTAHILAHTCRLYTKLASGTAFGDVHRWTWALRMRYLSVTMFIVSIAILLCCLYTRLGPGTVLLLGLLLAFEPTANIHGHYGMNDVPLVAMLVLAWLFGGKISDTRHLPLIAILSGFCLGLGFGIKYQAILGALFPFSGVLVLVIKRRLRLALLASCWVSAGAFFGCAISTPLMFSEPRYFFTHFPEFMTWQSNILGEPSSLSEKLSRNVPELVALVLAPGRWLLLPLFAANVYRMITKSERDLLNISRNASAMAFCAVLVVVLVTSRDIIRDNDLIPLHVFVIIISGLAIGRSCNGGRIPMSTKRIRNLGYVLSGIACIYFIHESLSDSLALSRPDTRTLARDWCRENVPAGSIVIRERYTLPIAKDGIEEHKQRYLSSRAFADGIRDGEFHYAIASSLAYERFFDLRSPYYDEDEQLQYQELERTWSVQKVFEDRKLPFSHPRITIYRRRMQ